VATVICAGIAARGRGLGLRLDLHREADHHLVIVHR
jgi:hypothetical protein